MIDQWTPNWVPVEKALPERLHTVLALVSGESGVEWMETAWVSYAGKVINRPEWRSYPNDKVLAKVICWTELPPNPRKEQG